ETIDYCRRLAAASDWVTYANFGTSPQGRELPLVILNKNGNFTPEAVRKSGQAVVLIQSCIHAGECDGKDASLMLMREIAITRKLANLLDHVTVLIIPIFNVDGHEKFGPYNRINQNGPEEMGYRATAQRLNLNRDFLKADAPEMRAWLQLFNRWLPDFLVDNHVTDGFDHQYALTYGIEEDRTVASPLRAWTTEVMEPYLQSRMAADGIPIFPYHRLKERPDLRKGITHFPFSPRYSTGYGVVQNRIFYLVETHALKDYHTRVTANYHLLKHMLRLLNEHYQELIRVNRESDRLTAEKLPGTYLPLSTRVDMKDSTIVDYKGVAFTITDSDVSGGKWVHFSDEKKT
ncbi:MAG: peptidase M14, partial [Calditrichaeota bacterium]